MMADYSSNKFADGPSEGRAMMNTEERDPTGLPLQQELITRGLAQLEESMADLMNTLEPMLKSTDMNMKRAAYADTENVGPDEAEDFKPSRFVYRAREQVTMIHTLRGQITELRYRLDL